VFEMSDAIPTLARDVLRLFETRMEGARFGDLDVQTLGALAEAAESRASAVADARAALEAAQAELEGARGELTRRAEQALAYARIHGADDPAVAEDVAAIDQAHAKKKKKAPSRRKRKRREPAPAEPDSAELPFTGGRAAEAAAC
jgi:hypothetical protein